MRWLVVFGSIAIALIVWALIRARSATGYTRRFAPMPRTREPIVQKTENGDSGSMIWMTGVTASSYAPAHDSSSGHGAHCDGGTAGHGVGGDCGASAGGDGGGGS